MAKGQTLLLRRVGNVDMVFSEAGDLDSVTFTNDGRVHVVTGREFLQLTDVVLEFAKARAEVAKKEREQAEAEVARLKAEGKGPHEFKQGLMGGLSETCSICGYTSSVAMRYLNIPEGQVPEFCPGSPEGLRAWYKAKNASVADLQAALDGTPPKLITEEPA